jgi:hypothetical protein
MNKIENLKLGGPRYFSSQSQVQQQRRESILNTHVSEATDTTRDVNTANKVNIFYDVKHESEKIDIADILQDHLDEPPTSATKLEY